MGWEFLCIHSMKMELLKSMPFYVCFYSKWDVTVFCVYSSNEIVEMKSGHLFVLEKRAANESTSLVALHHWRSSPVVVWPFYLLYTLRKKNHTFVNLSLQNQHQQHHYCAIII